MQLYPKIVLDRTNYEVNTSLFLWRPCRSNIFGTPCFKSWFPTQQTCSYDLVLFINTTVFWWLFLLNAWCKTESRATYFRAYIKRAGMITAFHRFVERNVALDNFGPFCHSAQSRNEPNFVARKSHMNVWKLWLKLVDDVQVAIWKKMKATHYLQDFVM